MLTSVSEVGTKIKDRREKAAEERLTEKKKWGPFRYFILVSTVFIAVMWGVILFGGESIPAGAADVTSNPRAFLFMVDSSVKRFAHYEKSYPKELKYLVPKYLRMRKENVPQLNLLSYQTDSQDGYHLSLAKTKPGEMVIILTSKGIQQKVLPGGGSR